MRDSNYTLKFNRTYREATGQDCYFYDPDKWDKIVGYSVVLIAVFFAGLLLGLNGGF